MRPGAALWLEPGAERVVRTRAEANKGIRRRQGGERTDELQLPEQIVHKDSMDSLTSCLLPDRSPFSLHRWRPGAPKKLPPGGPPCLSNILQNKVPQALKLGQERTFLIVLPLNRADIGQRSQKNTISKGNV